MTLLNALTFKQLRTLDAVKDSRSLSAAGEDLGLTAPAVHSQLKSLEENFGTRMLYRDGPIKFQPTPEGEALLTAHRKCRAALEAAVLQIEGLRRGLTGTVILGVVSTGKYFAPQLVASLKKSCPEIEIILKIGNRQEMVAALGDGSIDLAIMGRPPRAPALEATKIGDHPHVLIAPPDHPLAKLETITADDILGQTIILRETGSGTRIMSLRFFDRIGEGHTYDRIEMESNETIKQSVIAGLGIAIISRHTVTEELKSGRLVEIDALQLPIRRVWYILHTEDHDMTGAMRTVRDLIVSANGSFLPN